jgi:hypothetical protein
MDMIHSRNSDLLYHDHADHQYFNIIISNNEDAIFKEAKITKINNVPIVEDTSGKVLSLERISIPLDTIPLWYAKPLDENDASSRMKYTIGLEYGGVEVIKNLIFYPNSDTQTLFYWYGYTYSEFFRCLNETVKECFNELGTLTALPIDMKPPLFLFNSSNQQFSLVAQKSYYDTKTLGNPVKIWINNDTLNKIDGIALEFVDVLNAKFTNNKYAYYSVYDKYDNNWPVDNTFYEMKTDYNILSRFNTLRGIQIKSNLPVREEFIQTNYNDLLQQTTSDNILRDLVVNYSEFSSTGRTTIEYATNDRIYIGLTNHSKIQNIYIHIYWIDETGRSFPLYISSGVVKLKFCVKRKDMQF